mmetsp:Transcript_51220/g.59832  ORF Transcript_51220/g.59832 Transcript_51220/m.59832 type:complete len:101 (-) Transcript_51220:467-769(-)
MQLLDAKLLELSTSKDRTVSQYEPKNSYSSSSGIYEHMEGLEEYTTKPFEINSCHYCGGFVFKHIRLQLNDSAAVRVKTVKTQPWNETCLLAPVQYALYG